VTVDPGAEQPGPADPANAAVRGSASRTDSNSGARASGRECGCSDGRGGRQEVALSARAQPLCHWQWLPNLEQETEDPDVSAVSYRHAHAELNKALHDIKQLRLEQEGKHAPKALAAAPHVEEGHPRLALDEFEETHFVQRPHLMLAGQETGPTDKPQAAAPPISSVLSPIKLDGLTVADDHTFLDRVTAQINLPDYIAPGLRELYSG
jgi:hypothetical protein